MRIVLETYSKMQRRFPDKTFVCEETGWCGGGRIRPHKTHRNGLSVDFMVPVLNAIYRASWNRHPANREYIFQVDSEEKAGWIWGDAGTGYFGRGSGVAKDQWALAWQCY